MYFSTAIKKFKDNIKYKGNFKIKVSRCNILESEEVECYDWFSSGIGWDAITTAKRKTLRFEMKSVNGHGIIAVWYVTGLAGNCGTLILHEIWVSQDHRHKHIADAIIKLMEDMAEYKDYNVLMCTAIDEQDLYDDNGMERLMKRNGWKPCTEWNSYNTSNNVTMYIKHI